MDKQKQERDDDDDVSDGGPKLDGQLIDCAETGLTKGTLVVASLRLESVCIVVKDSELDVVVDK